MFNLNYIIMNYRKMIIINTIIYVTIARSTLYAPQKQYVTFIPMDVINSTNLNDTEFWTLLLKHFKFNNYPGKIILQEESGPDWYRIHSNPNNSTSITMVSD